MVAPDEVRMRLVRHDDAPATNPHNLTFVFGLQDAKQEIVPPTKGPAGQLVFDFTLRVKPGRDPDDPVFLGRFASGPVGDRFVYLSWRSIETGAYINRAKARLSSITWDQVRDAQAADRPLVADATGWRSGGTQAVWRLASD
jgi:Family of unknown function (DUF5990)